MNNRQKLKAFLLILLSAVFMLIAVSIALSHIPKQEDTPCLSVHNDYDDLFLDYKALRLEVERLKANKNIQLGEASSETTGFLPYYIPVDIQEPLPYIYESE